MAPKRAATRWHRDHRQSDPASVPQSIYREAVVVLTATELRLLRSHETGSTPEQLAVVFGLHPTVVEEILHQAKARLQEKIETLLHARKNAGDVEA